MLNAGARGLESRSECLAHVHCLTGCFLCLETLKVVQGIIDFFNKLFEDSSFANSDIRHSVCSGVVDFFAGIFLQFQKVLIETRVLEFVQLA